MTNPTATLPTTKPPHPAECATAHRHHATTRPDTTAPDPATTDRIIANGPKLVNEADLRLHPRIARACRTGDAGEDGGVQQRKSRGMTYYLGEKALGHTNLYFHFLDGDMDKVENEDRSIDIGINPPRSTRAMRFGRRVKTEFLPTRIRPSTNQSRMPDFAIAKLAQICLAKFRDVVETLEPGVHQFVPVQVVRKNGDHIADMFWFVPCNRLDTLDLKLSQPQPPIDDLGFFVGLGANQRKVFNRRQIGNHHVWIDKRIIGGFIWVSEQFHGAVVEAGLIGLNLIAKEAI